MEEYWIARDKDGQLCGYKYKPTRNESDGEFMFTKEHITKGSEFFYIVENHFVDFSAITWENSPVLFKKIKLQI